ncbi:MAG: glycoside hydrolase family 92 protein [Clostridia bacterium]|nr:glycoside hydrolase family 92 protein [Clostridia bacterium]
MTYSKYVDVFHGSGAIDLPEGDDLVKSWFPFKGMCGNTSPAAMLPFGKYMVSPYSGGYSAGYGINKLNCGEPIRFLGDQLRLIGFSHFQLSGTGAVGFYYNYAVVTPYYGEKATDYGVLDEAASPGYYRVTLAESGIDCELTAGIYAACHRYTFRESGGKIAVDFTNNGLYDSPHTRGSYENLTVTRLDDKRLEASVTLQGIGYHFVLTFDGNGSLDEDAVFRLASPGTITLKLSVSTLSLPDAWEEHALATPTFDETRRAASDAWAEALGRVTVESEDENELRIFYSNLYHSLTKPNFWPRGGFLAPGKPMAVDFCTLWDIYKTQLPLVYTLYPDISRQIVESFGLLHARYGVYPNAFLLSADLRVEAMQARMLAEYSLYDAWKRGIPGDWDAIADQIAANLSGEEFQSFAKEGTAQRATFTLDMSGIAPGLMEMAESLGHPTLAAMAAPVLEHWKNAFDPQTGLLVENSDYYEGNHWNYSFRPFRDMTSRVALAGGKEGYLALLDRFFGFANPEDKSGRFEGFNNETDMEAPWAYHVLGRYDRLVTLLETGDKYVFRDKTGSTGPGGIPGNNDSGGLSACYVWNCLGIFPQSGMGDLLVGKPKFERAVLTLSNGKTLIIRRIGSGIPSRAVWNGTPLEDMHLSVEAMMDGGELIVFA